VSESNHRNAPEQNPHVLDFYDSHPINGEQIRAKVTAAGFAWDGLTEDVLKDFDQDHYGGVDVVNVLAERAGIAAHHRVLDVCSGMGGPARWLAHTVGCDVTGLDVTLSRVNAAKELTEHVNLSHKVNFVCDDAAAMSLADGMFDVVISQEALLHIPPKERVIAECKRVLKPGGTLAFTDAVYRVPLSAEEKQRLGSEMVAPSIASADEYSMWMRDAGFTVVSNEDLHQQWTAVLLERKEMYRSLSDTTIKKFGQAHFDKWDATYSFFVGLFEEGKLGGIRMVAKHS
jgi:sarcosine/dimethylglycine N-methyltransferase